MKKATEKATLEAAHEAWKTAQEALRSAESEEKKSWVADRGGRRDIGAGG